MAVGPVDIDRANAEAVERMVEAQPILIGVAKARDVIPGFRDNLLLHAGPPVMPDRMAGPLRGAIIGALLFEGLARSEDEAWSLVTRGAIAFEPNHHHQAVAPMAGVISPSMSVYIIENRTHGNRAFTNLNEGSGKVLRFGAYSTDVLERLRWLEQVFAPLVGEAIAMSGGLDLKALFAEALLMGDEGHNRTAAMMLLFLRALAPYLVKVTHDGDAVSEVLRFIGTNALTVINPLMAMCKAMADAAHGVRGSTIVTAMARNGTEFGIRVSGLGDHWFTAPAGRPQGVYFAGFNADDASRDIGDSVITETVGIGHFAAAAAPAVVTYIGGQPQDAVNATLEMYPITFTEHRYFKIPYLGFRGTPTGIDIRRVAKTGVTPLVNTGIAHKAPGIGQIGAGLVRQPLEPFTQAVAAFREEYGVPLE